MSAKPETKSSAIQANATEAPATQKDKPARTVAGESPEKFRTALQELESERTALAKSAIENMKPGKPFDPAVVRQINKVETRKNRLIVSRFASLLRKGSPEIQTLVHQLVEL